MSGTPVNIEFGASMGDLISQVGAASEKMQGLLEPIAAAKESLLGFGAAFASAFELNALKEFAHQMGELGENVEHTSRELGLSVEQYSRLQDVFRLTGESTEGASRALEMFEKNTVLAGTATSAQAAAFDVLGVRTTDATGATRPLQELLGDVAEKFSTSADGANKTAIAMALFGRAGAEMIPFLDRGRDGLEALGQAADGTGAVLNEDLVAQMTAAKLEMAELDLRVEGLKERMFSDLKPVIDLVVGGFSTLINVLDRMGSFIDIAVDQWAHFVHTFEEGIDETKVYIGAFDKVIQDGLTMNWSKIESDWNAGLAKVDGVVQQHAKQILADENKLANDMANAFFGVSGFGKNAPKSESGGDKAQLANFQQRKKQMEEQAAAAKKLKDEERQAAQIEAEDEIKLDQLKADLARRTLDQELAHHQITLAQWLEQERALYTQTDQLEEAQLQKLLQNDQLTLVEKTKLNDQLKLMHQKYLNEIGALEQTAAQKTRAEWQTVGDGIAKNLSSSFTSVLTGAQTWGQAMGSIANRMVGNFVEGGVQILENMLINLALGEAATSASNFKTSMSEAYKAAAGAYSAVVGIPYVGPVLAPIAAGVAFAAVEGFANSASFDVGTPYVPHDMMAMIHQGEAVIPKSFAQGLRDGDIGFGGGGITVNYTANVSALDHTGMSAALDRHGDLIARKLLQVLRDNPTMRPK